MIKYNKDRYNGIIIDNNSLPETWTEFKNKVIQLIIKEANKNLVWIKIPIEKSFYIPWSTKLGFIFHHCNNNELMLVKKQNEDAVIPTPKNFTVGVGAIIFNKEKILVVKDRFYNGFKLPGGHIEKDETIKDTIIREVSEETGIDIEFESIMNIGHFRSGQFGESVLYFVCTAKHLNNKISITDSQEIVEARWMNINEFLKDKNTSSYNRHIVEAALENSTLKLTEQNIELKVKGSEVFY